MPTKRQILEILSRDELAALAERHGVAVRDRRSRLALAEGLDAGGPAIPELLAGTSRDRLKELCRALDLDDSGREKAVILARLAGGADAPDAAQEEEAPARPAPAKAAPAPAANGAAGGRRSSALVEQLDLPLGGKLTPEQLQRHLWSAADILRGSIDSSDYKNYIFGLIFLKRLSDRFDEEREALVAEGIDPEDHDEHQFFVPKRARWAQLQKVATNLGEALNKACQALEDENRSLAGVLAGIDFNDERKAERDGFRRFGYGVPPKGMGDLAFLQHMVATPNDKGQVGVVLPHGVLFRGRAEGEIRKRMLQEDLAAGSAGAAVRG